MKPPSKSSVRTVASAREALTLATLFSLAHSTAAEAPAKKEDPTKKNQDGGEAVVLDEITVEANRGSTYKPDSLASKKFVQPLRDLAQTVTVIPKDVIREQNATSLRDVLRNVPGISMQAGEGGGGPAGDNLSIRGFAARSDIFVDGIRDASSGGYTRDAFNIEQVEVTKGPASATTGRGSTGGSINVVTKSPHLGNAYGLVAGAGSDDYYRGTIDVNQEIPWLTGAAVRLNGLYFKQDIPGRDAVENERWGIAPSIAFGLGTNTRFTLSYMHLDQDNVPDYGIPFVPQTSTNPDIRPGIPDVDYENYYGNLNRDYETVRTDLVTGIFEHDFNENLSLRSTLRYGRNDRDSVTTAPRFVNVNTGSALTRNFQSREQIDTSIAGQTDLRFDFTTGKIEHKLVGGFEISREESTNHLRAITGSNPGTDLYNPNPYDPFTGSIARTGASIATDSETAAVYLFDTVELDKHWQISGGLRFDHFDVDYESRDADSAGGAATRLSREDSTLSYRAAITYKPVREGSIYLGYGNSFNPSTEGLTYIAAPAGTNSSFSLFDAEPEENTTLELGAKWEFFDEKLLLNAAIFQTKKSNARTVDPTDPTVVELTGEQEVKGFEFGFTGSITDSWRLIGGYTYLDSEVTDSAVPTEIGNEVSNSPDHSFSLWTVHDLPVGFQVGLGVQYVGERFNSANEASRQKAPSFTLVNAMVGYQLNENVAFRLNIDNLADEEYIDRLGGGHFVPGQGRSAVLSANITF